MTKFASPRIRRFSTRTAGQQSVREPARLLPPRRMFAPLQFGEHYHGPIWHFTDSHALVSMLTTRHLWASAATMMNDPRELTYGAKRIKRWYEQHGHELKADFPLHGILTQRMRTIVDDVAANPAYVISASTDYRVLNQWRNYGGTTGVAVRFDPHAELTPATLPENDQLVFTPQ